MSKYTKIYEDSRLLVIDKPPNILTVPASGKSELSLLDLLIDEYGKHEIPIFPCHRLDKETSGLIIFAKNKTAQKQIMDLFRLRKIKKKYIVIVQGWINKDNGEIKNYINEYTKYGNKKRLAITKFCVTKKNPEYSIIEAQPLTGRKNQLRIHFKQLGHPILGERRFAFAKDFDLKARRLCLHAWKLDFTHPKSSKHLSLVSPIPQDLKKFF